MTAINATEEFDNAWIEIGAAFSQIGFAGDRKKFAE